MDSNAGAAAAGSWANQLMMGGLPLRDLWLIPLISLLTILAMLAGSEVAARYVWREQKTNLCVTPDTTLGYRFLANCSSKMKALEGPWYVNSYNSCGYRSSAPCTPLPPGARRIALIGSSISEGYLVEYPDTIGARLGNDLSALCAAPVEVQNLGGKGYMNRKLILRMEEALTLHPDAVLLVVLPYDIQEQTAVEATEPDIAQAPADENASKKKPEFQQRIRGWVGESRAVVVAQHFLFKNPSIYLPLYLHYGDKADFLRPPFSAAWQERLRRFDLLIEELANRSRAAQVPFLLAFVPNQAQVSLLDGNLAAHGTDPKALPAALAGIAQKHGVLFDDTSPALAATPKPASLYYQVDGHPSGDGQPIIAKHIAQSFASQLNGTAMKCKP